MSLQVIAVGPPRTGTTSLKAALLTLGFDRCMHMDELFNQPQLVDYWTELFDTGTTDFDALFLGYRSSTDFPGCLAYRQLLERYPAAKFIVNYREPESWYASMLETVYAVVPRTPEAKQALLDKGRDEPRFVSIAKTLALVNDYLLEGFFAGAFTDKEQTLDRYARFYDELRATIPPHRRLEYDVRDGWDPLCTFLNTPVPAVPFPRKNQRADFIAQVGGMIHGGGALELR